MEPLHTSNYSSIQSRHNAITHPVLDSTQTETFEDWAFTWSCQFIDSLPTDETKQLFDSFKNTIFPYMVLHALLSRINEQRDRI